MPGVSLRLPYRIPLVDFSFSSSLDFVSTLDFSNGDFSRQTLFKIHCRKISSRNLTLDGLGSPPYSKNLNMEADAFLRSSAQAFVLPFSLINGNSHTGKSII
jgi:hypothetical protein